MSSNTSFLSRLIQYLPVNEYEDVDLGDENFEIEKSSKDKTKVTEVELLSPKTKTKQNTEQ